MSIFRGYDSFKNNLSRNYTSAQARRLNTVAYVLCLFFILGIFSLMYSLANDAARLFSDVVLFVSELIFLVATLGFAVWFAARASEVQEAADAEQAIVDAAARRAAKRRTRPAKKKRRHR
jgi:TRAP-type C4-dicarboxylate transport system permease small subunit